MFVKRFQTCSLRAFHEPSSGIPADPRGEGQAAQSVQPSLVERSGEMQCKRGTRRRLKRCALSCLLHFAAALLVVRLIGIETDFGNVAPEKLVSYQLPLCQCSRTVAVRSEADDDAVHWCNEETSLRGPHQNVVAFSLYGDAVVNGTPSKYYIVIDTIPREVRLHYPDWRLRIYHGLQENQQRERDILCHVYCSNDNVDLCDVNEIMKSLSGAQRRRSVPVLSRDVAKMNRMNWRILPMIDPTVDTYLSRDVDSQINARETAAVNQWLQSQFTFHVMRDHWGHGLPIMGGMFGVKVHQQRRLVEGLTRAMIQIGTKEGYNEDQALLELLFWPSVKDDALIHDSYWCEKNWNSLPTTPYPTQRDPVEQLFVSERVGAHPKPGVCPVACRPAHHKDWQYC